MRILCTYLDSHYLARGLTLYESLVRHAGEFRLWILCFDDAANAALKGLALPGIVPVLIDDFETAHPEIAAIKPTRTRVEYYFSCTAAFTLHVVENEPAAEIVSYVDADLFVFSDLTPLLQEFGSSSIGIIPHRYPVALKPRFLQYGEYNVGWVLFRCDAQGRACLTWWRDKCIDWCFDYPDQGRFADQGYLNQWPALFQGVCVIQNPRANLAPWSLANQPIHENNGIPIIDDQPVIFYHFQGVKQLAGRMYDSGVGPYGIRLRGEIRSAIYQPYVNALEAESRRLATWLTDAGGNSSIRRAKKLPLRGRLKRYLKTAREILLPRNFIIAEYPPIGRR